MVSLLFSFVSVQGGQIVYLPYLHPNQHPHLLYPGGIPTTHSSPHPSISPHTTQSHATHSDRRTSSPMQQQQQREVTSPAEHYAQQQAVNLSRGWPPSQNPNSVRFKVPPRSSSSPGAHPGTGAHPVTHPGALPVTCVHTATGTHTLTAVHPAYAHPGAHLVGSSHPGAGHPGAHHMAAMGSILRGTPIRPPPSITMGTPNPELRGETPRSRAESTSG